jgi:four helix bundle protein
MGQRKVHSHEDLVVWRLARQLAAETYRMTARLPRQEQFGLQSQMRRAAISVASNLAEGAARETAGDFRRFVSICMGSLAELETQCLLCEDLGLLARDDRFLRRVRHLRIMLASLRRRLR